MHRLATVHARDNQTTTNDTPYLNKRLFTKVKRLKTLVTRNSTTETSTSNIS